MEEMAWVLWLARRVARERVRVAWLTPLVLARRSRWAPRWLTVPAGQWRFQSALVRLMPLRLPYAYRWALVRLKPSQLV
jgi:hypothetical protein